jgi:FtsP/CotA-like multicopper oxidase with cupredoxin domain
LAALPAWNVVHLHGAVTGGGNDGWTENAVLFGESQLSDQPAMTLWCHDHVMVNRYNVMAGLAGMYLLRDEEEDRLGLPSGDAASTVGSKILNVSGILHPVHIHLIRFQALSAEGYDTAAFLPAGGGTAKDAPVAYTGPLDIEPAEQGWKDVIRVPAGTMVSVAGRFGGATGRFMYHCHILEHEDAGMMRPFSVMPGAVMDTDPGMGHGGDPGHEHA